jgi:DUF1365 family protein
MKSRASNAGGWLMVGRVLHERLRPARHRFVYPVFCVRCDLARLDTLDSWWFGIDRWRPLSLYARDYGPCDGSDLLVWIRGKLAAANIEADGAIWLQTFPRLFGYAFNPVSFWLCHDRDGQLRALLAEVRNTFGARHAYLLTATDNGPIDSHTRLHCRKALHVSPFCAVEGHYAFRLHENERGSSISIDYHDAQGLLIRTAVAMKKLPLTRNNAMRALARQPLLTVGVVARIHFQALLLWLKKVPFYGKQPPASTSSRTIITEEQRP